MHPVHDIDALVLLSLALASKRRPADLVEVIAALDLLHGAIPAETKLAESFARLAAHGLIGEEAGRFALSAEAQKIIAGLSRKAAGPERIFGVKAGLAAHEQAGDLAPIVLSAEQLRAAVQAHRAAGQGTGPNLLMPKPPAEKPANKRPGRGRMPAGARGRRS